MTLRTGFVLCGAALFAAGWTAGTRLPAAAATASSGVFLREDALRTIAQRRSRSIVFLHALGTETTGTPDLLRPPTPVVGLGSGIVVDRQGLILTNSHVLEGRSTDGAYDNAPGTDEWHLCARRGARGH